MPIVQAMRLKCDWYNDIYIVYFAGGVMKMDDEATGRELVGMAGRFITYDK